jgi:hypothetical protein
MVNVMKHDLKAINAAIQLGDKCIPLLGCRIRFATKYKEYAGIVVSYKLDSTFNCYVIQVVVGGFDVIANMYLGFCVNDVLLEILHIPDNVLSFEEWTRY